MGLTVIFILQCDYCEKTEEASQVLTFLPSSATSPIMLDISEDLDWEILDNTLYCAPCAEYLQHSEYDA